VPYGTPPKFCFAKTSFTPIPSGCVKSQKAFQRAAEFGR